MGLNSLVFNNQYNLIGRRAVVDEVKDLANENTHPYNIIFDLYVGYSGIPSHMLKLSQTTITPNTFYCDTGLKDTMLVLCESRNVKLATFLDPMPWQEVERFARDNKCTIRENVIIDETLPPAICFDNFFGMHQTTRDLKPLLHKYVPILKNQGFDKIKVRLHPKNRPANVKMQQEIKFIMKVINSFDLEIDNSPPDEFFQTVSCLMVQHTSLAMEGSLFGLPIITLGEVNNSLYHSIAVPDYRLLLNNTYLDHYQESRKRFLGTICCHLIPIYENRRNKLLTLINDYLWKSGNMIKIIEKTIGPQKTFKIKNTNKNKKNTNHNEIESTHTTVAPEPQISNNHIDLSIIHDTTTFAKLISQNIVQISDHTDSEILSLVTETQTDDKIVPLDESKSITKDVDVKSINKVVDAATHINHYVYLPQQHPIETNGQPMLKVIDTTQKRLQTIRNRNRSAVIHSRILMKQK